MSCDHAPTVLSEPLDLTAIATGPHSILAAWQPPLTPSRNPAYYIFYIESSQDNLPAGGTTLTSNLTSVSLGKKLTVENLQFHFHHGDIIIIMAG